MAGPHVPDEIDVFAAVQVVEMRLFRARDEKRLPAHAAKRPHGRVHPAGNIAPGFGKHLGGTRAGKRIWRRHVRQCSMLWRGEKFTPPEISLFARLAGLDRASLRRRLPPCAEGLPREKGSDYLEDFFDQPYRLRVLTDAPIYFNADQAPFSRDVAPWATRGTPGGFRRAGCLAGARPSQPGAGRRMGAGALPFARWTRRLWAAAPQRGTPQSGPGADRARRGRAQHDAARRSPPASASRRRNSSHTDAQGVAEAWDYIRYEQVPRQVAGVDAFGRAVVSIVYERVPVGHFSVVFTDGLVSAIDQSERETGAATPPRSRRSLHRLSSVRLEVEAFPTAHGSES